MRLNVDIKNEIYDEMVKYCENEGRSLSDVIRGLVVNWNVKKRREELLVFKALVMKGENDGKEG